MVIMFQMGAKRLYVITIIYYGLTLTSDDRAAALGVSTQRPSTTGYQLIAAGESSRLRTKLLPAPRTPEPWVR